MTNTKYQTGLKRFVAAIIDGLVFLPLYFLEQWLYNENGNLPIVIGFVILLPFLPILYSITLHYKFGQTIGKRVMDVKVLNVNEEKLLSLWQAIFRDSFYIVVQVIGLFYFSLFMFKEDNALLINEYRNFADQPLFWWTLLELITMLTNSKRRALHDFIAKSVVVRS